MFKEIDCFNIDVCISSDDATGMQIMPISSELNSATYYYTQTGLD